jgi:inhibitor of cysteine peptidase
MTLIRSVAAAVALLAWSAAAGEAQMDTPKRMVVLTEKDHDRTVELHVGEGVRVTLPENATTGYRWAIEQLDPQLIEARAAQPKYPADSIGSGGEVQWDFLAKAPGTTSIVLKQWRHWEGDASIVQRFRIQVRILPRQSG